MNKDDRTGDLFSLYSRGVPPDMPMREAPADCIHPTAESHRAMVEAHARRDDPDTSHDAARSISPRLRELQERVLEFAAERPDGFTDIDLNHHFDTHSSTYRTRRSELVDQGLIRDTGERKSYGAGGTGRRHIIWQITLKGLNKAVKG